LSSENYRNALKLTYSNLGFELFFEGKTPRHLKRRPRQTPPWMGVSYAGGGGEGKKGMTGKGKRVGR
jgi:hypothetical protein